MFSEKNAKLTLIPIRKAKCDRIIIKEFLLILQEIAAIGVRLSHASQGDLRITGEMLSNTLIICPLVGDNLGKLRLISDREIVLERIFPERLR